MYALDKCRLKSHRHHYRHYTLFDYLKVYAPQVLMNILPAA